MTNNKFKYIIQDAIRNHDESYLKYTDYFIFEYCSTKMYNRNNNTYIDFYVKKKYLERKLPILENVKLVKKKTKFLFKTYICQFISLLTVGDVWQWGWSISNIDKKYLNVSKQIFDWAFINNGIDTTTKDILLTSKQQILNDNHLVIFLSLSLYLSKYDLIYKRVIDNYINYYVLKSVN